MISVYVSKETYNLVQAKAILPFQPSHGIRYDDGSWSFALQEETVGRLQGLALKGETLSDTIFRILSGTPG